MGHGARLGGWAIENEVPDIVKKFLVRTLAISVHLCDGIMNLGILKTCNY